MNGKRAKSLLGKTPQPGFAVHQWEESGFWHVTSPYRYPDRDPVNIYFEDSLKGPLYVRICDYGSADMRVSFLLEIDSPQRQEIYTAVLDKYGVRETDDGLEFDVPIDAVYEGMDQFAQCALELCHPDTWIEELRLHGPITEAVGTPVQN